MLPQEARGVRNSRAAIVWQSQMINVADFKLAMILRYIAALKAATACSEISLRVFARGHQRRQRNGLRRPRRYFSFTIRTGTAAGR